MANYSIVICPAVYSEDGWGTNQSHSSQNPTVTPIPRISSQFLARLLNRWATDGNGICSPGQTTFPVEHPELGVYFGRMIKCHQMVRLHSFAMVFYCEMAKSALKTGLESCTESVARPVIVSHRQLHSPRYQQVLHLVYYMGG